MDDYYSDTPAELIHCDNCGEDYAATYKACPFCHTAPGGRKTGARSSSRSKPRTNTRGGGYGGARSPLSIIGIILSVILLIAALIIIVSLAKSALSNRTQPPQAAPSASTAQKDTEGSESASGSAAASTSGSSAASASGSAGTAAPVLPSSGDTSATGSQSVPSAPTTPLSITLDTPYESNVSDQTLVYGETLQMTAVMSPADSEGQIIWSSSDGAVATVDQTGLITYVAKGTCTITASCGDVSAECIIRCRAADSDQVRADLGEED